MPVMCCRRLGCGEQIALGCASGLQAGSMWDRGDAAVSGICCRRQGRGAGAGLGRRPRGQMVCRCSLGRAEGRAAAMGEETSLDVKFSIFFTIFLSWRTGKSIKNSSIFLSFVIYKSA
ncbi:hypothetical protein RchiOBHm_Chr2g0089731 [Rosa chinensis]|uniref:Uncharacterized protein n=1 Tax=Rosa chinensis TaxID=74649 RepID=A0A2P6RJA5_ROSCH|nr:hypothetical protein RchiOBHm_Chr2g0089731 [Rosa chinensis]